MPENEKAKVSPVAPVAKARGVAESSLSIASDGAARPKHIEVGGDAAKPRERFMAFGESK